MALRLLLSRVETHNIGPFPGEYLQVLDGLREESDLRKLIIELTTRLKSLQRENSVNKENGMGSSNVSGGEK